MKISKPPFSYYGGKQRMASKIVPLLPPHSVYVEPFCGSASVMFAKGTVPGNSDYYREVINDTNNILINFFRVLQDPIKNQSLCERLEYTLYSDQEYKLAKDICKAPDQYSDIELAWAWFLNSEMSFANIVGIGFGYGVSGCNESSAFNNKKQILKHYTKRLSKCFVFSIPAIDLIKKWDSPQTCFYVDPPYPDTEQGHYKGFTQSDFEHLIEVLKQTQGSVVLSCYNNPAVPEEWEKHEFHAVASSRVITNADKTVKHSRAKDKRTECVWIKPASVGVRLDLERVLRRNKCHLDKLSGEQMNWIEILETNQ